ncbi:MAG: carboxypeptidase-like regulatory domain-containing protein [Sphingobacteriales bacterium JAD_PAG50586_3]|nr:MAG: carboxypeptidase-like regulatory domain-containing protein [Sphingobacteriales bacterium JAD_PAG50586_3]
MRLLFVIICFIVGGSTTFVSAGSGQPIATVYTNKVIDATTKKAIPFVNIGVLHKGIGTVSDEQGNFTIDLTGAIITDTVKFSCIGYDDLIFSVEQLKMRTLPVPLRQKETILSTVVIKPKFYKSLKLGVVTDTDIVTGGFSSNDLGSELATVIPYNKKDRLP